MKTIIIMLMWLLTSHMTFSQTKESVKGKIDTLFHKQLELSSVHNAFLRVYSGAMEIDWNYVGGAFENGDQVLDKNPFHSTSVAKTLTAVLIMLLQEEGRLEVEDPLAEYLPVDIIEGLHIFMGTDYSREILIRQLLQHTSGLPDHFTDTPRKGPTFTQVLLKDQNKIWQPYEIINFGKSNLIPHFPPGKDYRYSDMGYVLLGLLIEEVCAKPYHQVLAEKILDPLGMENTYVHLRSRPRDPNTKTIAELYHDEVEISSFRSLSADWAGGGIATTTSDLLNFYLALNQENIISKKSLRKMKSWTRESFGLEYGYGLRKFELKKLYPILYRFTLIGHSGSSGAYMYYSPEIDVYLIGTFNQTAFQKKHVIFMIQVLANLTKLSNQKIRNNEK